MSKFSTGRLLSRGLFQSFSKPQFATPISSPWTRLFSHSAMKSSLPDNIPGNTSNSPKVMETMARSLGRNLTDGNSQSEIAIDSGDRIQYIDTPEEPYHFHIYSHRRNTHITVTKPNRDAIISMSCGNLGFRKAQRKQYDAAYQLGAYVVDKMHQMGLVKQIQKMEVILRGFGQGREAVVKVLLGSEGKYLRPKIIRVADATRLKFGGTRSPKPRRV